MASTTAPPGVPPKEREIKLISHSDLFYWWPVWFLAFVMAAWTYFENNRLAIVPRDAKVTLMKSGDTWTGEVGMDFRDAVGKVPPLTNSLADADRNRGTLAAFPARISQNPALGPLFIVGLVLTMIVTNVPLRGLWSFMVLILIATLALFISLINGWDTIFDNLGKLHVHINMAGYLLIGGCVFVVWALAVFVFDRRSYIIFTPGQIRYCEHIGAGVQVFPSVGAGLLKQRDDLFRHYILGFGSGDLIVHTGGPDRKDIKLPNVLGIGWRLRSVEDMLRQMATTS